jgi:ABC-type molybdate transport system permease subunit
MDKDLRIALIAIISAVMLAGALGYYFATITVVGNRADQSVTVAVAIIFQAPNLTALL